MKLTDLDPNWIVDREGRTGMGVTFRCPCRPGCDTYLGVWFANPIDGGPPASAELMPKPRWQRSGESFETLTLAPSVDASASGHWHGFITSGQVR
jgi:hypothetical protein